ncbi:MAG: HAD family hydrolase [Sedimentisphaerales bacterium]|nr:HAD family hydrolase [Sedimentisphaerales bacterium]
MSRAVFLDRDGVINRVIVRDGLPFSPATLDEFILCDGVEAFLAGSKKAGFLNIVITNQPDIARGLVDTKTIQSMHESLRRNLPVDDVFLCPHDDADNCNCRKPKAGMLTAAAEKWDIDLASSFIIGDQWKDAQAGKSAGCVTILLDCPYNKDVDCDYRALTLRSALKFITR